MPTPAHHYLHPIHTVVIIGSHLVGLQYYYRNICAACVNKNCLSVCRIGASTSSSEAGHAPGSSRATPQRFYYIPRINVLDRKPAREHDVPLLLRHETLTGFPPQSNIITHE